MLREWAYKAVAHQWALGMAGRRDTRSIGGGVMGDSMHTINPVAQFAEAIYRDLGAVIEPIADGILHRFDDPNGRRHNNAGWYALHLDELPAGVYGSWRTGYKRNWRAQLARPLTEAQLERNRIVRGAKSAQQSELHAKKQAAAQRKALQFWGMAESAKANHPYLVSKSIPPHAIRQLGDLLLVPLRNTDGDLVSLQRIYPDGTKKFLAGGRITGCFVLVGQSIPETGKIIIAEGFATASTIAYSRHVRTIAAMTADNLIPVAEAIRRKYPNLEIIIAADNDHLTPDNPGLAKGRAAATAVGGTLTWPANCGEFDCSCTDFNDIAGCKRLGQ